ncbi:MAG: 1-aminocyclopropane-1-carboxylate deaminase/D-cysteine desulfhydrase [Chitinophagaceae bacterium]
MMPLNLMASVDLTKATIEKLQDKLFDKKRITVEVLRTDLIHPVISGNKWFKLKYHLDAAIKQQKIGLLSLGGAYSNHLLAVACTCNAQKLLSVGIVRGEEPAVYSPTLLQLRAYGMQLLFTGREQFKNKLILKQQWAERFSRYYWVNEGGQSEEGVQGAQEILSLVPINNYSHIICAAATGTMMAGLLKSSKHTQYIIGIPVLKINDRENNELITFLKTKSDHPHFSLLYNFEEGGYAKKTPGLIAFMNTLYKQHQLPTDFVYTGKLFRAIFSLAENNFFPEGSNVLAIHSGGLQGNRSLAEGELIFKYNL